MHFHRTWHDDRDSAAPRLFEVGEIDRTVSELLTTVAQLKSFPRPQAQKIFVAELRDRLIAEALDAAVHEIEQTTRDGERVPRLQRVHEFEG